MTTIPQLTPLRSATPTVTLEVMAREAAVSHWSDRPVVQVLRYHLQIRSTRGEGLPVEIRGDRDGFLALEQAIHRYIQADLAALPDSTGDRSPQAPYLEAQGLTRHLLHLGSQPTTTGASTVALGAVQLADLGEAFAQLEAQVRILPIPLVPAQRRRGWRQWGTAAAGVVAAVGLTTALWPTYQSQREIGETALEAPSTESVSPAGPPLENQESIAGDGVPESRPTPAADVPEAEAAAEDSSRIVIESAPKTDAASSAAADPAGKVGAPAPQPGTEPPTPVPPAASPPTPSPADAEIAPQQRVPENTPADSRAAREAAPTDESAGEAEALEPFAATADAGSATPPRGATTAVPLTLEALATAIAERWTPPDSLTQALTYTLSIAADGTLTEVTAADEVAEQYRDRAGLPALGTPILPPGDAREVRVILADDGQVDAAEIPADPAAQ